LLFPATSAFADHSQGQNEEQVAAKGTLLPGPPPRVDWITRHESEPIIDEVQIVYQTFFEDGIADWTIDGSWGIGIPTSGPGSGYQSEEDPEFRTVF